MIQTKFDYDDPYKLLAYKIIALYRPSDVKRLLADDQYLLNCIVKENRSQDVRGDFLDCIIEDILEQKKRMEYMHKLDKLAEYYVSQLNVERFRKEVILALKEMGVEYQLENPSSGGSALSANT